MNFLLRYGVFLLLVFSPASLADKYQDTVERFRNAGTERFINSAYGYAVFPTIGKGGFIIGGAYGRGRVFQRGNYVGDSSITMGSIGLQLGGQAYSQMIFLEDKRAFDEFTSGEFEFGVGAQVVALTAGATAEARTGGARAAASGEKDTATLASYYHKGMAIMIITTGGLMGELSVAGQRYGYKSLGQEKVQE